MRARRTLRALLIAAAIFVPVSVAHAQPPTDSQWNNFSGAGTSWSFNANNWDPAGVPTSDVNRVLGFGSSNLQAAGGYTTTFDSAFNLNSLVLTSAGASNPSLVITGAAASSLRFNTSAAALAPSIWQNGSGRVLISNGAATSGITLVGGTTLQIRGTGIGETQLTANIVETGGTGSILINQSGTRSFNTGSLVRLGGVNTFTGGVNLTAGNLVLANNAALGTGALIVNGGTLQFESATAYTIANPMTLNSNLVLTGFSTIVSPAPAATFSGVLSGNRGVNVNTTSGSFYAFTAANTFSGAVNIEGIGNFLPTVSLGTATIGTGSAASASAFNVGRNTTLILDNTVTAAARTSGTAPLNLNRSTLTFRGNAAAITAENFGTLTVNGTSQISAFGASATLQTQTLTFAGLNRGALGTGTISIAGTNLGSGTGAGESIIRFTSDPGGAIGGGGGTGSTSRSILPYMYVDSSNSTVAAAATSTINNLVRWDSISQRIAPLTTSEYVSNLYQNGAGLTPGNNNLRYTSTVASPTAFGQAGLNTAISGNALVLDTNTAAIPRVGVSLSGTGTLTVGSGTILSTFTGSNNNANIPSMINLGGLSFGANPGYVHTVAGLTINSPVSGSAGLVKSGFGALNLMGTNTFTGGLTVNSGLLNFASDANLGAAGQSIVLNNGLNGSLNLNPFNQSNSMTTGNVTVNRPITVGAAGGVVSTQLVNNNLTLSGNVTGSGTITKAGAGVLTLTGNNTGFTGTVSVAAGTLAVGSDSALGSASSGLILGGGSIQATSSFTINRDVLVTAAHNILPNGNNLTIAGNLTSQTAAGTLLKDGPGDLILTGANTLLTAYQNGTSAPAVRGTNLAATTNSGRTVLQGPNGSLSLAGSVLILGGGEVVLDNTGPGNVNNNRIGNVNVSMGGGAVTLRGNAAASVTEAIAILSYNASGAAPFGGTVTLEQPASILNDQVTTLNANSTSASTAFGTFFVRGTNLGGTTGDRTALILGANPAQSNYVITGLVGATTAGGQPTDFLTTSTIAAVAPNAAQFSLVPCSSWGISCRACRG